MAVVAALLKWRNGQRFCSRSWTRAGRHGRRTNPAQYLFDAQMLISNNPVRPETKCLQRNSVSNALICSYAFFVFSGGSDLAARSRSCVSMYYLLLFCNVRDQIDQIVYAAHNQVGVDALEYYFQMN